MNRIAFIDSQNLNKSVEAIGQKIDYQRFRLWLKNKHGITRAIMFFGYMDKNKGLYTYLRKCGFELVFREVEFHEGRTKGNVDIVLTITAIDMLNAGEIDRAFLISSDGDFMELVERFKTLESFGGVISPQSQKRCSGLLKKSAKGKIDFVPDLIGKFGQPIK